jgi:DNA-directed RNA polymerase subunit F
MAKDKLMAEIEEAHEMANTYKHLKNNKPRTVEEFMEDQKAFEERKAKNLADIEPKEEYSFMP